MGSWAANLGGRLCASPDWVLSRYLVAHSARSSPDAGDTPSTCLQAIGLTSVPESSNYCKSAFSGAPTNSVELAPKINSLVGSPTPGSGATPANAYAIMGVWSFWR